MTIPDFNALSSDARAVVKAIREELRTTGDYCHPSDCVAAAAIRAVVEQCTYVDDYGTYLIDPADLLAIATELENPQ